MVKRLCGSLIPFQYEKISTENIFPSTDINQLFLNGVNIPTPCFCCLMLFMFKDSDNVVVRVVFFFFSLFFCS